MERSVETLTWPSDVIPRGENSAPLKRTTKAKRWATQLIWLVCRLCSNRTGRRPSRASLRSSRERESKGWRADLRTECNPCSIDRCFEKQIGNNGNILKILISKSKHVEQGQRQIFSHLRLEIRCRKSRQNDVLSLHPTDCPATTRTISLVIGVERRKSSHLFKDTIEMPNFFLAETRLVR